MNDVFISYAHIDNESLTEGQQGWISQFHRTLEVRLRQLMGENPQVWRDQKLMGNDIFDEKLVKEYSNAKVMISIVSPRYMKSDWCQKEALEFHGAAENSGGVFVGGKSRIIKVVKTPVQMSGVDGPLGEVFERVLGFEFFEVDSDTGRIREYNEEFGREAKRNYLERVYDLAQEISDLLQNVDNPEQATDSTGNGRVVYLAETTNDLRNERDRIRRELMERGHTVLPDRPLPLDADEATQVVDEFLEKSHLAIHLVGQRYGVVPEGGELSMVELQTRRSAIGCDAGAIERLVWMPSILEPDNQKHEQFIQYLTETDEGMAATELLRGPIEQVNEIALKALVPPEPEPEVESTSSTDNTEEGAKLIYLICDQTDEKAIEPIEDHLFDQGYEVKVPQFDGDEATFTQVHQDNLRFCNGVLIYFGEASSQWVEMKLMDLLKAPGYGREKPLTAKAVYVGPPDNRRKSRFRTRNAEVIQGSASFEGSHLSTFLNSVNG